MATSQGMLGSLRVGLLALLLIAPGVLLAARILHPAARGPVRFAIDSDGALERVELVQHGDD